MNDKAIFGSKDLDVKYVSSPGLKGQGGNGIITFSRANDATGDTSAALLISSASLQFARTVSRQFFLNVNGIAYLVGVGNGSLTLTGLLGKSSDFVSVFGVDLDNPCGNLTTATLDVTGMTECTAGTSNKPANNGIITLGGLIPVSVAITASVQNDGLLFYSANATFQFSKLSMGDR